MIPFGFVSADSLAGSRVLVLGDSISAAYGIDKSAGWVTLLQKRFDARLDEQCSAVQVINASVSGETTHGGRVRLPGLLAEHQPRLVIIELGGNDGLRGLAPKAMQENLSTMVRQARAAEAQVIMLGILIPPNYGAAYQSMFERAIGNVAESEQVPFVKFFLEGIGGHPELMQKDGMHPVAAAQTILLDNAWVVLEDALETLCGVGSS